VATLAAQDGDGVVEARISLVSGRVECRADDLSPVVSGAAVAAVVEGDPRAVVRLDHALEVGQIDVVGPQSRVIEAAEATAQEALAAAFGKKDAADVRAIDVLMLRVGELDAVERLEPHLAARRSTYLARTSTSRLTLSPVFSEPSVVASSVWRTNATSKASSLSAAIVSETPSTVIEPFSTQ
jgi:hypothetical protein